MKTLHKAALIGVALALYSTAASAQLTNQGMLDQVVTEFATRATSWQTVVMNAAMFLFWTLGTISLVFTFGFMALLDVSIVNVAIPSIVDDLKISSTQVQWVQEAYTLVFASMLLLFGSLADRIGRTSGKTVRDLVRAQADVRGFNDISDIVARDHTRLDILASDTDPHVSEAFSDDDYRSVAEVAAHFYSVVLTDTGTGIVHSVMGATLERADDIVVVAGLSVDEARLASETLTWLEENGYRESARDAVVVLNASRPGAPLGRRLPAAPLDPDAVHHRRRRFRRGGQVDRRPSVAEAPQWMGRHPPRRARDDRRLPLPERRAPAPRNHDPQGIPRKLRPPRPPALRAAGEVGGRRSAGARVFAPALRHSRERVAHREPS